MNLNNTTQLSGINNRNVSDIITDKTAILLTTMGTTWQIVPELIGFTNPDDFDLYKHHPEHKEIINLRSNFAINPVSAVWVVTTSGMTDAVKALENWHQTVVPGLELKIFPCEGVNDLATADECEKMADLIFRTVLHASKIADNLLISLAGGRKTMSADMQRAAFFWGCHALLHVVDRKSELVSNQNNWKLNWHGFRPFPRRNCIAISEASYHLQR